MNCLIDLISTLTAPLHPIYDYQITQSNAVMECYDKKQVAHKKRNKIENSSFFVGIYCTSSDVRYVAASETRKVPCSDGRISEV